MSSEHSHLGYLVQTIAWMGGSTAWASDMIAEQLGEFDDPRIDKDLREAAAAGLVVCDETGGYRLSEEGWALAASER